MDSITHWSNAFIASRVDHCNAILDSWPSSITDRLQRLLNAAARLVTFTAVCHDYCVPERIECKTAHSIRAPCTAVCRVTRRPRKYIILVHFSSGHCQPTPPTFSRSTSPDYITLPVEYIWSSSHLCCRPDGLKLYRTASETRLSAAVASCNYWRRSSSTAQHCRRGDALYKWALTLTLTGCSRHPNWLGKGYPFPNPFKCISF